VLKEVILNLKTASSLMASVGKVLLIPFDICRTVHHNKFL